MVLRHEHKAGEKVFVDYAGQGTPVVDHATGEVRDARLFPATLGASSHTYTEATRRWTPPDGITSHARLYAYFGGVPRVRPCRTT